MTRAVRMQGVSAGLLILATGLIVRFPIPSVSPVLPRIGDEYSPSASQLAMLSAIPVLLFGLAAPLAPLLSARFGAYRATAVLLACLAVATLLHLLGESAAAALMVWGIPLLIATGLAFAVIPRRPPGPSGRSGAPAPASAETRTFRIPGVWSVTGFFGCQALVYFSMTSWLPVIAQDRGVSVVESGLMLAWMSLAGLPASLLASRLSRLAPRAAHGRGGRHRRIESRRARIRPDLDGIARRDPARARAERGVRA